MKRFMLCVACWGIGILTCIVFQPREPPLDVDWDQPFDVWRFDGEKAEKRTFRVTWVERHHQPRDVSEQPKSGSESFVFTTRDATFRIVAVEVK